MSENVESNELEIALEKKRRARLDPMLSGFGMNSRPIGRRVTSSGFISKVIENTANNITASVPESL